MVACARQELSALSSSLPGMHPTCRTHSNEVKYWTSLHEGPSVLFELMQQLHALVLYCIPQNTVLYSLLHKLAVDHAVRRRDGHLLEAASELAVRPRVEPRSMRQGLCEPSLESLEPPQVALVDGNDGRQASVEPRAQEPVFEGANGRCAGLLGG